MHPMQRIKASLSQGWGIVSKVYNQVYGATKSRLIAAGGIEALFRPVLGMAAVRLRLVNGSRNVMIDQRVLETTIGQIRIARRIRHRSIV